MDFAHCVALKCIYVFLLFPEVQKCCFRHCARLFVYLCISIISISPEMLCFQALCQIICVFILFPEVQKCYVSGTVPDYLFICVFILFPEVQKCYVFRHCARLFVYLCIYFISRCPEMLFSYTVPDYLFIYIFILFPEVQKGYVFRHCALCKKDSSQWSVFETDITMS